MVNTSIEGQRPPTTILDSINNLFQTQNEWNIKILYALMLANQKVIDAGLKPTFEQFKQYLEQVRRGFEYARDTYGIETLPHEIIVYERPLLLGQKEEYDWIGYIPEKDELGITPLHIAGQSAHYDDPSTIFIDYHLTGVAGVRGKDYTVLQAIEEGYHRYQYKVLRMKMESGLRDVRHPLEAGVVPVYFKAIRDLNIQLIPATGKPI